MEFTVIRNQSYLKVVRSIKKETVSKSLEVVYKKQETPVIYLR